jgi:hypothetical protein
MASKQATLILRTEILQQRRQIDLQIAHLLKLKITRCEEDKDLQHSIDRATEPLAQAAVNLEAMITDLDRRLR